jgi:RHS repeat-associated protein
LHYLTSIFLTLLFFLTGGDFAVAKNQVSSASIGFLCTSASQKEFLTTDRTDSTDKRVLGRQGTTNAKVFNTSLESLFRDSTSIHSFSIFASLGDLCALAVNSSFSRTTTGSISQIIPSQTQFFTVNDRLTTDTYDANGNTLVSQEGGTGVSPVSSSSVTDVYSFDNKLIRRTTPDGKTIDLTYTPDGHRLSKFITQNGLTQRLVHYLTDANNPTGYAQVIEEKQPLDTTSPLKKVNLYGHDLISTEERGTGVSPVSSIFYTYDGLGSVRSISNASGDLQETYDYDAYGTLIGLTKRNPTTGLLESSNLSSTIPDLQSDYLYTGEQWDADLGMYFLRARYLNTNTGRFHSQDTYEGRNSEPLTLHKYLYASGNPAMFTDPSGNVTLGEMSQVQGMQTNMANYTTRVTTAKKYTDSVYKVLVTMAVTLNTAVAGIGSKTGAPQVIIPAAVYAAKELKEFHKKSSLGSVTIKKILRISKFIAKAAAMDQVAGAIGLRVSKSPNGFPDFNDVIEPRRGAVFIPLTGDASADERSARLARGLPNPPGYTWHHHEAIGIMMLVPRAIHIANGHSGGVLFWEILNDKEYKR